jgi:CBS domain-containing membrane protein
MKLWGYFRSGGKAQAQISGREKWIGVLACWAAISLTAWLSQLAGSALVLVASMGASAVILFVIPSSPLAQPWAFFGGQFVSALMGVFAAAYVADQALAAGLAVGGAVLGMMVLRCLHPPGAATALVPVLAGLDHLQPGFAFILNPLGINVALMLLLALLINRLVLGRDYPIRNVPGSSAAHRDDTPAGLLGVDAADIEQATRGFDHFIDIGTEELRQIFIRLQLLHFQKNQGTMRCGEIMQTKVITLEYATEVESAWLQMHRDHLKAMPVLDRSRRVIGIVTQHDFLKNLQLTHYQSFQEKWLAFIRRTPKVSTDKPEAIGHIMTRKVNTLAAEAPIAELIPLVVDQGHTHVPIVDSQDRFVGMVTQTQLMAALFNQQAAPSVAATTASLVREDAGRL